MAKMLGVTVGFVVGMLIRFSLFTGAVWASIVILNSLGLL
jgi:hypothetical protein